MTAEVIGAPVISRVIPSWSELVSNITWGGRVGIEVDHALLVAPDKEGAIVPRSRAERGRNEDLNTDTNDFRWLDGGKFNIRGAFKGPKGPKT